MLIECTRPVGISRTCSQMSNLLFIFNVVGSFFSFLTKDELRVWALIFHTSLKHLIETYQTI